MKKILTLLVMSIILSACSGSDDRVNNPFIPNVQFDTGDLINTNLPEFNHLKFPSNYYVLNSQYGINGVVLYYAGGDQYSAFELTDPNHSIKSCSSLTVENAVATCDCDDGNSYDIIIGSGFDGTTGNQMLKRYFVEANGNTIRVFNN